jgi:hypothetical protein
MSKSGTDELEQEVTAIYRPGEDRLPPETSAGEGVCE